MLAGFPYGPVNVSGVPLRYVATDVIEQLKLRTGPISTASPVATAASTWVSVRRRV
jgi:hypothetical protein